MKVKVSTSNNNTIEEEIKLLPKNIEWNGVFLNSEDDASFNVYIKPDNTEVFDSINKFLSIESGCQNYSKNYFLWFEVMLEQFEDINNLENAERLTEYKLFIVGNPDVRKAEDTYIATEVLCELSDYEECLIASMCATVMSDCIVADQETNNYAILIQ